MQMGLGRKIDPEPGRCRRTDGKKWRCSKEAYPDSKYCERHMHRGKNRSRKPVEVLKATPTTTTTTITDSPSTTTPTILSITKNSPALTPTTTTHSLSPLTSVSSHDTYHHQHQQQHPPSYASHLHHSFLYHHQQPSRSSNSIGLSFHDNSAPLFLDTGSCSQTNTECRFFLLKTSLVIS